MTKVTWDRVSVRLGLFGRTVRIEGANGGRPVRTRVIGRLLDRAFKKRLLVQAMGDSELSLGEIASIYFDMDYKCSVSSKGVAIGCCLLSWPDVDRFVMSMGWRMEY